MPSAAITAGPDLAAFNGGVEVGIYAVLAVVAVLLVLATLRRMLAA